jgi:hypothetical protein
MMITVHNDTEVVTITCSIIHPHRHSPILICPIIHPISITVTVMRSPSSISLYHTVILFITETIICYPF